ncbi:MAG: pilin [bacterium]|nr:pilin [bacterium]MDO8742524.1 pilin [bacterium]
MQFFIVQIFSLALVVSAVSAYVPIAHAQLPSQSCSLYGNNECPSGQTCVATTDEFGVSGNVYGVCRTSSSRLTPLAPTQSSGNGPENVRLMNPLKGSGNLESFLTSILDFVIRIGTIVVILMVVYVGFEFVTARGDPAKISKARESLLWTVIGALILLGAKAIAIGIEATVQAISVGS